MKKLINYYHSSIGRKQVVAVTGLALILYLIAHLAGNLLILGGPQIFNRYAAKLASLRPALYGFEIVLLIVFITHIWVTYTLVLGNIRARSTNYLIPAVKGDRSLAAQLMPFTGSIILAFVVYHLWDFTLSEHSGARCILRDGKDYGLYGLVYNSFSDPLHSTFYIIAMVCVGFHLSHAVESFCQTFGLNDPKYTPRIRSFSHTFGVLVGWGFSMIPVYVLIKNLSH